MFCENGIEVIRNDYFRLVMRRVNHRSKHGRTEASFKTVESTLGICTTRVCRWGPINPTVERTGSIDIPSNSLWLQLASLARNWSSNNLRIHKKWIDEIKRPKWNQLNDFFCFGIKWGGRVSVENTLPHDEMWSFCWHNDGLGINSPPKTKQITFHRTRVF